MKMGEEVSKLKHFSPGGKIKLYKCIVYIILLFIYGGGRGRGDTGCT